MTQLAERLAFIQGLIDRFQLKYTNRQKRLRVLPLNLRNHFSRSLIAITPGPGTIENYCNLDLASTRQITSFGK